MDHPPEDDLSKQPVAQPAVQTAPEAAVAFKAAMAQARKEGFTVTQTDLEHVRLRAIPLALAECLAQMQEPAEIAEVLMAAINRVLEDTKG